MKGKVSCFQYLCQSNTSLRSLCCRGHPVCFIRNREIGKWKGQNIPQADYLVFEQELWDTNTKSLLIQLTSTSIFTQAVISFWLWRLCNHWIQKTCHTSVVICWSRNCPHCQEHKWTEDRTQHTIPPLLLVCTCCHWLMRGTPGTKWVQFPQKWNLKRNKEVVFFFFFFNSMIYLNASLQCTLNISLAQAKPLPLSKQRTAQMKICISGDGVGWFESINIWT